MLDSNTILKAEPIIEAGSSAADAIGQALDRSQDQSQVDAILTREIPYTTTIKNFDRLGRIQCRNGLGDDHFDQPPVEVTITESIVRGITNTVSTTVGASLTTTVEASIKSAIPGGSEASVSTSVSGTVEASKTITNAVQTQLSRSVGVKEMLEVTFHADECFEHNNPYGLCLEITVTGTTQFKQNATIARGNDGLFHYTLQNSGTITSMTIEDVDVSLDPCVKPDESPTSIPECKPASEFGFRLPVDNIDGIGKTVGDKFREYGIRTVGDLASVDFARTFEGIPRAKLLEFRAKAQIVVNMVANIELLAPLADHSVGKILDESPESLGVTIGDQVPVTTIMRIQEELATLLVAIDESTVRDTALSELVR